jgi:ligand-binding sensor domain-containing protein
VSTAAGVEVLEKDQLRTLVKNLFVTSFAIDNSILWIATRDRGVLPFNTQTSAPVFAGAGLKPAPATVIKKLNPLLVASAGSEISVLENRKHWRTWNSRSHLLTDVNVSSLLRTRNGELWIGYFDRGLDILSSSGNEVTHFSDENLFCINHISEDHAGRKYVSTSNGLVIFQPDRSRKVYRTEEGLLSDRVMQTLPLDPEGKVVAIATTQGFTLKEGESMKSIYAFHGLVNNHIYTMAAEGGQIYLGTLGGISRVNKMQVTESWTQMDSGLKRNWVNALLTIDRQLFVGTYGSGIQIKTENGEWRDFPTLPEDLEINPNALYYDGMYLFCGTLDRGFYVFDTKKNFWKQITRGLPSLNVTAFSSDEHFLYIGTDRGLLQMTYDNIRTTADNL